MPGQDRDAVLLAEDADGGLEMQFHPERLGYHGGLVDSGLGAADPNLLERHDIGLAGGDHLGDAPGGDLPVGAQPAVYVVGENARHRAPRSASRGSAPLSTGDRDRTDDEANTGASTRRRRAAPRRPM